MRFVHLRDTSIYFFRLGNYVILNLLGCKIRQNLFFQRFVSFNNKQIIFKFTDKGYFKRLVWCINQVANSVKVGYYTNLYLKGLGFRIRSPRRLKAFKMFKFWLGHSVYKYILPSPLLILKRQDKFNLLIFSPFLKVFNDVLTYIFLLRVIRPYKKIRGITDRRTIYLMRPAKIR